MARCDNYLFAVIANDDGLFVAFVLTTVWETKKAQDDHSLQDALSPLLPTWMQGETMEGVFEVEEGHSIGEVERELGSRGFKINPKFDDFVNNVEM